jgi:hypothetical protein
MIGGAASDRGAFHAFFILYGLQVAGLYAGIIAQCAMSGQGLFPVVLSCNPFKFHQLG